VFRKALINKILTRNSCRRFLELILGAWEDSCENESMLSDKLKHDPLARFFGSYGMLNDTFYTNS